MISKKKLYVLFLVFSFSRMFFLKIWSFSPLVCVIEDLEIRERVLHWCNVLQI